MKKWQLKQVGNQWRYKAHTRGLMPPHPSCLGNGFFIDWVYLVNYILVNYICFPL